MTSKQFQFVNSVSKHIQRYYPACDDVCYFIASQFALESDFGQSNLARNSFNFCGMKRPYMRPHVVQAACEFSEYDSFTDCVIDYALWLAWNHFSVNYLLDKFIIVLRNSGYCPEKDYIAKIQTIYSQFKSYQNGQTK